MLPNLLGMYKFFKALVVKIPCLLSAAFYQYLSGQPWQVDYIMPYVMGCSFIVVPYIPTFCNILCVNAVAGMRPDEGYP